MVLFCPPKRLEIAFKIGIICRKVLFCDALSLRYNFWPQCGAISSVSSIRTSCHNRIYRYKLLGCQRRFGRDRSLARQAQRDNHDFHFDTIRYLQ